MSSTDAINSILKRGAERGLDSLAPVERKVFLISEAEVLCDMEGIDSFLDRYGGSVSEAADAFAAAGATQIAESLRAIHAKLPARSDELLNRANSLVTARDGYDYDSVARLVSDEVQPERCRRPAGSSGGSDNLSATLPADRAFPAPDR